MNSPKRFCQIMTPIYIPCKEDDFSTTLPDYEVSHLLSLEKLTKGRFVHFRAAFPFPDQLMEKLVMRGCTPIPLKKLRETVFGEQ